MFRLLTTNRILTKVIPLALGLLSYGTLAWANCTPPSGNLEVTPDSALVDNANGTITHTTTGLMWKKCPQGFSDTTCTTGAPEVMNWGAALKQGLNESFAGQTDWRLPSRTELLSIIETGCSTPAINTTRFPNSPTNGLFWTSSHAGIIGGELAWGVRFGVGVAELAPKTNRAYARLVRGGTADESYIGTAPAGGPNAFSFNAAGNQTPGATVTSNIVTLAGVTGTPAISISGGSYRINGGAWTTAGGTVANGNTVQLQVTLPSTNPATRAATVTINGRTASFTASTETLVSTEPNQWSFAPTTAAANTVTTSETKTISGLTQARSISIAGQGSPQYSINGGAWTNTAGSISNSQTVAVRLTSGCGTSEYTATLTINTESANFVVTSTGTPGLVDFTPVTLAVLGSLNTSNSQTVGASICAGTAVSIAGQGSPQLSVGGGAWTTSSTINPGQTIAVRLTAAATVATTYTATLTVGTQTVNYVVSTQDNVPDPFVFTDQTAVLLSSLMTSNAITVAGVDVATPVSVAGGTYSKNGGAFTATAGSVINGDTVAVQHTSSASFSTATNTVLTIGSVSDTFTSTTEAADTVPSPFAFTDQVDVPLSSVVTSNAITVAGINSPSAISVVGGTYNKNGGAFTSVGGTVVAGDTVSVQHTSAATNTAVTNTTLTIGGVSDIFSSTTVVGAGDSVPDPFTFTDQTNVALSTLLQSNAVTITGLTVASPVSITGGEFSVNGGAWATSGTVSNNQTITVRHTSSASFSTLTNTVLTVGGISDTFTTTTLAADTVPNPFSFTDQTAVALSTLVTSNTLTVAGLNTAAPISVTGGEYQVQGGAWTSAPGSISNGQTFAVRHTSSASFSTVTNTILDIGGITDTFTSTTLAIDTTPNTFTFVDQTNVALATMTASAAVTITGINAPASISVSGAIDSEYQINGGAWTSAVGSVNNNDTVAVRHTSSPTNSTAINTTLTVGGVTDTFTTTTVAPACGIADWAALPNFTNVTIDKNATCTTSLRAVTNLCAGATYTFTKSIAGGNGETKTPMQKTINGSTYNNTEVTTQTAIANGASVGFKFVGEGRQGSTYTFNFTITTTGGSSTKTWVVTTNAGGACPGTPP